MVVTTLSTTMSIVLSGRARIKVLSWRAQDDVVIEGIKVSWH